MGSRVYRLNARVAQTITAPGRHADGGNLYLNVTATGARSWVLLYKLGGRQREMGLGSARDVPLARARELAASYRQALAGGRDPLMVRNAGKRITFGEASDQYIDAMSSQWRNPKHVAQWRMTLREYAGPIRAIPVDAVTTEDVLGVLKPIWTTKPETAGRVRGRIERVLDWAAVKKLRSGENPARWRGHLDHLLPKRQRLSRHHRAMPIDDVPVFMERLAEAPGLAARGLGFLILTAARSNEVLGARWPEIDFARRLWTIPAARMKATREHRVPLPDRAVAILREMAAARQSEFVFQGDKPKRPLSTMAFAMLLRRMGVDATTHGFRSSFKDWATERTSFPHELSEMALAHAIKDKTEAAYRRGDLLEKRRQLMTAWARFCASGSAAGKVVTLRG